MLAAQFRLRDGRGKPVLIVIGCAALATSLLLWLGRRVGIVDAGQIDSVFLLVGLMCVFLGALKARDAAMRRDANK